MFFRNHIFLTISFLQFLCLHFIRINTLSNKESCLNLEIKETSYTYQTFCFLCIVFLSLNSLQLISEHSIFLLYISVSNFYYIYILHILYYLAISNHHICDILIKLLNS